MANQAKATPIAERKLLTQPFLSVDPLAGITGEPYQYVNGDPLNFTDPLGLKICWQALELGLTSASRQCWKSGYKKAGHAVVHYADVARHATAHIADRASNVNVGKFFEGADFALESAGAASLGALTLVISLGAEIPSAGLSTAGVVAAIGLFIGAVSLAYVSSQLFIKAFASSHQQSLGLKFICQ